MSSIILKNVPTESVDNNKELSCIINVKEKHEAAFKSGDEESPESTHEGNTALHLANSHGGNLDMAQDRQLHMEIENILRRHGALRANAFAKVILLDGSNNKSFIQSQRISRLQANWLMNIQHNTSRDSSIVLLIVTAVFIAITFLAALNFPRGSLIIGKLSCYLLRRLFVWFDSVAFITSAASMILILMHEIPFKSLMLVSVFSLFGAYICSIRAVSPGDALPVFLLGTPILLFASLSTHLPLHPTTRLLRCLRSTLHKSKILPSSNL